jgi:hypothetical protein
MTGVSEASRSEHDEVREREQNDKGVVFISKADSTVSEVCQGRGPDALG